MKHSPLPKLLLVKGAEIHTLVHRSVPSKVGWKWNRVMLSRKCRLHHPENPMVHISGALAVLFLRRCLRPNQAQTLVLKSRQPWQEHHPEC